MLKVLIVDDEALARETVKLLVNELESDVICHEAADGHQGLSVAERERPDIIVLDIEMPGMSGVELAKYLPSGSVVIFATAFNEYAVTAFELNAIDYLLKPFNDERFSAAWARAKQRMADEQQDDLMRINQALTSILEQRDSQYRKRLVIRDPGRIRLVDVGDIDFISGAGNYAEVHLSNGTQVLHRETLSALEGQLDPDVFVRIHRSSIVRRNSIVELRPNDRGDYQVILKSGETLTLSRRHRNKFDQIIG